MLVLGLPSLAVARPYLPRADASGNYFRNDGPIGAKQTPGPGTPGSLWRVISWQLNGRADADKAARIICVFPRGTVLQADVGRGGSDEVNVNAADKDGDTWMRVRTREGIDLNCYVRAHRKCIEPLLPHEPLTHQPPVVIDTLQVGKGQSETKHRLSGGQPGEMRFQMDVSPYALTDLVMTFERYDGKSFGVLVNGRKILGAGEGGGRVRYKLPPSLTRYERRIGVKILSGPEASALRSVRTEMLL